MIERRTPLLAAIAGAALIALAPGSSFSQPKPAQNAAVVAKATEQFFAGQELYADKKFDEALVQFRASFAAAPSPNNHLYIARCLRELGRLAAAYDEYAQVIVEAADRATTEAKYAATQKAAAEERAALKSKVATITVAMPPDVAGASLRVGSDVILPGRWKQEIAVDPGRVVVRAEAPDRAPFERDLTLAAGEKQEVVVDLSGKGDGSSSSSPSSSSSSGSTSSVFGNLPIRPIAYAAAGVGVAGFALFGILGLSASSKYDDLRAKCDGRCGPEHQDDVDSGRALTTVSNVGLALGIIGVAGGVGLYVTDLVTRKPVKEEGAPGPSVAVRVSPDPTAPGVFVSGSF
jgi:hypothetical protein